MTTSLICASGSHSADIKVIWNRVHPNEKLALYDAKLGDAMPWTGTIIVGINKPSERRRIAELFTLESAPPLIDPSVIAGESVIAGNGCVVAPHVTMLHSVRLGGHVHINYNVSMTRCTIGDFTTVCPGAVIAGDVEIGSDCLIGANATICDRVKIGNSVTIGAGAIVLPQSFVPDNARVVGLWPAKP